MSLASLYAYTVGFGLILLLGLVYAAVRRSVPHGAAALFFASPAPFFGFLMTRYEASLPPEVNIRLDWPFMWLILLIGAALSTMFAAYLLVDLLSRIGVHVRGRREPRRGPLRSWQNLSNPHEE